MLTNQDEIIVKNDENCCKFKYRLRWFNSKEVGLILLWTILVSASIWYHYRQDFTLSGVIKDKSDIPITWISPFITIALLFLIAPVLAWLADTKLGMYKMLKTGSIFLFIASVLASVLVLTLENLPAKSNLIPVATGVIAPLTYIFACIGAAAFLVTGLQLGLDQMPHASAVNITSCIAWFVFCFFAGILMTDVCFYECLQYCLHNKSFHVFGNYNTLDNEFIYSSNCSIFRQTLSIFPVICMSIVLCSDFLFAKKWLIIEPNPVQSLKLIGRVLKFAAKHKAPVNRSELTYWEESIPSRMDLCKARYGGPFTTEQVEDVKTMFKLIMISLPFFIIVLSIHLFGSAPYNKSECDTSWCYFINNSNSCVLIGTLVYEFVIYPLIKNKLPTLLKSIGIVSFISTVMSIVSLSLSVAEHFCSTLNTYIWYHIVVRVTLGFLLVFSLSFGIQFMCAQSPYSVRTLVTGCVTLLLYLPGVVMTCLRVSLDKIVPTQYYLITFNSLTTGLSIVGFVLHWLLARWYKGRLRDDIFTPHRLVEEVYVRYPSHQTPQD